MASVTLVLTPVPWMMVMLALEVRNEAQEQLFQELNPDLFTKDERDKVRH